MSTLSQNEPPVTAGLSSATANDPVPPFLVSQHFTSSTASALPDDAEEEVFGRVG